MGTSILVHVRSRIKFWYKRLSRIYRNSIENYEGRMTLGKETVNVV